MPSISLKKNKNKSNKIIKESGVSLFNMFMFIRDLEDLLEKGMAIHSSILAWRIPWIEGLASYSLWGWRESDWVTSILLRLSCKLGWLPQHPEKQQQYGGGHEDGVRDLKFYHFCQKLVVWPHAKTATLNFNNLDITRSFTISIYHLNHWLLNISFSWFIFYTLIILSEKSAYIETHFP